MFFIGIFGINSKEEVVMELKDIPCMGCSASTYGKLIKVYRCFEFFFIPLFKWDIRYFVRCERCGSVYEISKENGEKMESGEDINLTYWDLHEFSGYSPGNNNVCPGCGRRMEGDFEYCPYCGRKLR